MSNSSTTIPPTNPPPANPTATTPPAPSTHVPLVATANAKHMPVAGSREAPLFQGSYAKDYLQQILDYSAAASLKPDDVVDYIVRYCAPEYREQIRFRWEFDVDNKKRNWAEAAAEFISIYGYKDEPLKMTIPEFLVHLQRFAEQPAFSNKDDVQSYYNSYRQLADPLRKDATITDTQHDHFFILGIPTSLKGWFESMTPADKTSRDNPLSIQESRAILNSRHDETRATWEPWSAAARQTSPSSASAVNFSSSSPIRGPASSPAQPERQAKSSAPDLNLGVDSITDMLKKMSLEDVHRVINAVNNFGGRGQHCRVCDKSGADLNHEPGFMTCPTMQELVHEGLVVRNAQTNRLTLPDGRNIPFAPRGSRGGIAGYLRSRATVPATASSNVAEASASCVSLVLETPEYDHTIDHIFSVDTLDVRDTYPALRSGRDSSNRYDPTKRPDASKSDVPPPRIIRPPQNQPPPSSSSPTTPPAPQATAPRPQTPAPSKPASFPPPNNPINTKDGWKRAQPSKGSDVSMKDGTYSKDKSSNAPGYYFTSDAQEEVDMDALFARLSDQARVTLSFRELLGCAPKLEERMNKITRRRRQATNASSEAELYIDDPSVEFIPTVAPAEQSRYSGTTLQTEFESRDEFHVLRVFISNHGSAFPPIEKKLFAMVTGVFNIDIAGRSFRAMIDSGSELNLANAQVPESTNLPLDFEGKRWSLKGLGGQPERLGGCLIDCPMRIGRHDFPHHLFAFRSNEIGNSFDIILGQPFLHFYSASINYARTGQVMLLLWKGGDRDLGCMPTISVSLVNPTDPRSKSELPVAPSNPLSRIEEVFDEDFR